MTAIKVIDKHNELVGSGDLSHEQLDSHVNNTEFVIMSGSGPVPTSARKLTAGSGITIIDGGPGNELTISSTASGSLASSIVAEVPSGSTDGINSTFILSQAPFPSSSLSFFINGVLQTQGVGADYALTGSIVNTTWIPGSGSNIFATYPFSAALSGSVDHAAIRQLIHLADGVGGPFEGFTAGAIREILPSANPFPTSVIWYNDLTKAKKIVEKLITRNPNQCPSQIQWKVYDTDGASVLATVTDAITYSGVFETDRTRTVA